MTGQMKELEDNREYPEEKNLKTVDEINTEEGIKLTNGRYYLRHRKIDYNLLHSGRSQ